MKILSKRMYEYKTFKEFENRFYPNSQKIKAIREKNKA